MRDTQKRLHVMDLPAYGTTLAAYHRAYAPELRGIVTALPLRPGHRVLDVACGDGTYMAWMAPHVRQVVGVDISFDYMQYARYEDDHPLVTSVTSAVVGDADDLPFTDHQFDLVWCAQSLYDLPDTLHALREMRRVVRPGGLVVVFENDQLHHILLPWPVTLELAIQQAELQAARRVSNQPGKFYIGRRLGSLFRQSGLYPYQKMTYATNRHVPFDDATREFLHHYLRGLQRRVKLFLTTEQRRELEQCIDLDDDRSFFNCPDLTVTCLDHVMWGIKLLEDEQPQP